ncbi:MAG: cupin [Deltaproteobacteria bacterium HGW-Deltaproteobacteria-8]|jgi:quercetin dioxygenase-like cupin family protein|nr:MAG: cupin [Deltaproteobacteria bacterium HGW-Deltaproteobacteria-8]
MKITDLHAQNDFKPFGPSKLLVHESEFMKVINFNFKPGQGLPIHSHDLEGELVICVLEGEGFFLSSDGQVPCKTGDTLVCPIATPHGVTATSDMRVLVTIAPPI